MDKEKKESNLLKVENNENKKNSFLFFIFFFLFVIMVSSLSGLAIIGFLQYKQNQNDKQKTPISIIDNTKYQAVFLDNGQIYFGKVTNENEQFLKIQDAHFLKKNQEEVPPNQNQESKTSLDSSTTNSLDNNSTTSTVQKNNQTPSKTSNNTKEIKNDSLDNNTLSYTLEKIENEFYKPNDLLINREHIVYIENLKEDSNITLTIQQENQ